MTEPVTPSTKDEALKEIESAVNYLLDEREQGNEDFEPDSFYDEELQNNIISNFEGLVTAEDYQSLVKSTIENITAEIENLPIEDIESEVEQAVEEENERDLDELQRRISDKFDFKERAVKHVRNAVSKKYLALAEKHIGNQLLEKIKSGIKDPRELMQFARKHGFQLSPLTVQKFVSTIQRKARREASFEIQKKIKSDRERTLVDPILEKQKARAKELYRQRMMANFTKLLNQRRKKFLTKYRRPIKFTMISNTTKNGNIVLTHEGKVQSVVLRIQTIFASNAIENVVLGFIRTITGKKRKVEFDLAEMANLFTQEDGLQQYTHKLNHVNNLLELPGVQEIIWLFSILYTERNQVPAKIVQHIKEQFIHYLNQIDMDINRKEALKVLDAATT